MNQKSAELFIWLKKQKPNGQRVFKNAWSSSNKTTGDFPISFRLNLSEILFCADDLSVGAEIEISYKLSGRKWQKDPSSEVNIFSVLKRSVSKSSVAAVETAHPPKMPVQPMTRFPTPRTMRMISRFDLICLTNKIGKSEKALKRKHRPDFATAPWLRRKLPLEFLALATVFLVMTGSSQTILARVQADSIAVESVRPNIILVNLDDADVDLFSDKLLDKYLPNIKHLATEGLRFTNCHVTTPLCGPSGHVYYAGNMRIERESKRTSLLVQ